MLHIMSAKSLS